MVTLRDCIVHNRRKQLIPGPEARMAVARTLVMSFFRLHSVGWLHEDFNSDNVLLSSRRTNTRRIGIQEHGLGDPYKCEFNLSRQDMPYELTERVPTQTCQVHLARERSYYHHPELHVPAIDGRTNMTAQNASEDRRRKSDHVTANHTTPTASESFWSKLVYGALSEIWYTRTKISSSSTRDC